MIDWHQETGWARHSTFGLRREWVNLYLSDLQKWKDSGGLGNRQVESMATWLRTCGIEDAGGGLTFLGRLFVRGGTAMPELWQLVWVNAAFNWPTARWYVHLGNGEWTTKELKTILRDTIPRLTARTLENAILELVGTLERTPIGDELGQGLVTPTRPRRVTRRGIVPVDAAIVDSIGRLYLQQKRARLLWEEDLTWPWVVFGCSPDLILDRLLSLEGSYFSIDEQGLTISAGDREGWLCGNIMTSFM
ncbi:MAG TPA: hypothetical protein GXX39_04280 [Syntrophothermus lipocalidus]|nr:hypothetical protein [Syntrophothermus lipocalidus]